jgi:predicted nucleotidyltransferase
MNDLVEIAKNSGNFSALGSPTTAAGSLKAMLASRITNILDERKLSVRATAEATGYAAADFSRIRGGKLDRFTVDRLMAILGALDPQIELSLIVRPKLTRAWIENRLRAQEGALRDLGIVGLSLFGSTAREEAVEDSDIDVLVDYDPTRFDLKDLYDIRLELEERMGAPVHVTVREKLRPEFRRRIEAEAVRLF